MQSKKQEKMNIQFPNILADNLSSYENIRKTMQIVPFIIDSLNPDLNFKKEWMVKINEEYDNLSKGIIGEVNIINGSSLVGKTGLVYWIKNSIPNTHLIKIDCLFHLTDTSFITALVNGIAQFVNKKTKTKNKIRDPEELSKNLIINQSVKLSQLDKFIKDKPQKFIIMIKNADKLVAMKRQFILYNLFQWIKTDIKENISIVLLTKRIDILDGLEKRIRSRLSHRMVTLYPPKNVSIIKNMIDKRIEYAVDQNNLHNQKIIKKIRTQIFHKNTNLDEMIENEINHAPKNLVFFLQAYRLALAFAFPKSSLVESSKHPQNIFNESFKKALTHLSPYINKDQIFLLSCNFPEYFVMGIIRILLLQNKPIINFKQIMSKFYHLLTKYGNLSTSFKFSHKVMERATRNLNSLRLIQFSKLDFDFQNAEIVSNMTPQSIEKTLKEIPKKPLILGEILNDQS